MNTKLIVGCISGAGALGGIVGGSYYLLNKETEKSQEANDKPSQQAQQSKEVVPKAKPTQTLKEALAGPGFTALDTKGREHDNHWKTLIEKHKGSEVAKKINIDGEFAENTSEDDLENIKKLQKACSDLFEKTENYENDKETARNWCNKESELVKAK